MKIKTAYSTKNSVNEAVAEIYAQLNCSDIKLILYFASSIYDGEVLSREMHKCFDTIDTIGCSTAGELVDDKMLDNSIVAMAFGSEAIEDFKIEVLSEKNSPDKCITTSFENFEQYFKLPMHDLDYKKYVGLILIDGLSLCEEKIMDKIGDRTNVIFVGGSAGDDLKFKQTYIFANGKQYSNAAVIALLKPACEYSIIKTESFVSTGKTLKVTKANEATREIIEFNNKPATSAYSEVLGVSVQDLKEHFFLNPLGLMAGDEPFVRSPRVIENTSIHFYCSMVEGMELHLLKSTDIIADTQKALHTKKTELGGISGIINFNCILRTLELKEKNLTTEYGKLFAGVPTIGFSTYGECYLGHINQTATMLVFK